MQAARTRGPDHAVGFEVNAGLIDFGAGVLRGVLLRESTAPKNG